MKSKKDKSGIIYVLEDSAFPDHIRLGYTSDLTKKLKYIEGNKPFKTCKVIFQSDTVETAHKAYCHLTIELMQREGYKFEPKLTKGWHSMVNKPILESVLLDWLDK